MVSVKRALLFGVFIWLIPFAVAFAIFPLRESARPLFESIMPVSIAIAATVFGLRYFRGLRRDRLREGVTVGLLWFAVSVIIDLPLMLLGGPMQMTVGAYTADIAVTYLMIPVITMGIAVAGGSATTTPLGTQQGS